MTTRKSMATLLICIVIVKYMLLIHSFEKLTLKDIFYGVTRGIGTIFRVINSNEFYLEFLWMSKENLWKYFVHESDCPETSSGNIIHIVGTMNQSGFWQNKAVSCNTHGVHTWVTTHTQTFKHFLVFMQQKHILLNFW